MMTNIRSQVLLEMRVLLEMNMCKGFGFDVIVLFAFVWLFSFWIYLLSEIMYDAWDRFPQLYS